MTTLTGDAAAKPPKRFPPTHPRRGGFKNLLRVELRLLKREPMLMFWALIFPIGLLVVIGSTVSNKPKAIYGGLTFIDVYAPVLMMFTLTMLTMTAMPATLASYRDKGYLKRLSTTPVGAPRLLAVHITIVFLLSSTIVALIVIVSHLAFNVPLPSQFGGFVLAILLTIGAMAALGMLVAALAPTQRIAGAIGGIALFPLMFFAGLWVPQQQMGPVLRHISQYTPLGAAVPSIEGTEMGNFPSATHLIVLAAWALVLTRLAIRFFRWNR